jgi:hypothetical protein
LNIENKISVVNKYKHKPTNRDFYIGRGSPLGNPFTSIRDRETKAEVVCDSREESIQRYEEWLNEKILKKDSAVCGELNRIFLSLREGNTNLVCYCSPKPCHGDVIKKLIESKT